MKKSKNKKYENKEEKQFNLLSIKICYFTIQKRYKQTYILTRKYIKYFTNILKHYSRTFNILLLSDNVLLYSLPE